VKVGPRKRTWSVTEFGHRRAEDVNWLEKRGILTGMLLAAPPAMTTFSRGDRWAALAVGALTIALAYTMQHLLAGAPIQ
jgi:hypothetical protein